MSKTPRKSIAELSAQSRHDQPSPRPHVTTSQRENVSRDVIEDETTKGIPTKRVRGRVDPDGKRTVVRREKPHTSVYMHPDAMRKLREIAAAEDCKPHDVLLEGLRMVFARFGYDFDQLDRGGDKTDSAPHGRA